MGKQRRIPLSCLGPGALQQLRQAGVNVDVHLQKERAAAERRLRGAGVGVFGSPLSPGCGSKHKFGVSAADERTLDGITFASKFEMNAYRMLRDLRVRFELQPEYELMAGFEHEGKKVRSIRYVGDFKVFSNAGDEYLIDTKGMKTRMFEMKRKMLLNQGIVIHCIKKLPELLGFLTDRNCLPQHAAHPETPRP